MARFRSGFLKFAAGTLVLAAVLAVTHAWWLAAIGRALIRDGDPAPADIAVTLAGDYYGHRILRAAELVKQGFVPAVLVDGPAGHYGLFECDLAVPYAVKHGYPREWFVPFPIKAHSTEEEARLVIPELRRRGVRRFLLVTSDYHTRRAGRIFARVAKALGASDIEMRVVGAADEDFHAADWWRSREGQKIVFMEISKTLASYAGI